MFHDKRDENEMKGYEYQNFDASQKRPHIQTFPPPCITACYPHLTRNVLGTKKKVIVTHISVEELKRNEERNHRAKPNSTFLGDPV